MGIGAVGVKRETVFHDCDKLLYLLLVSNAILLHGAQSMNGFKWLTRNWGRRSSQKVKAVLSREQLAAWRTENPLNGLVRHLGTCKILTSIIVYVKRGGIHFFGKSSTGD